MRHVHAHLLNRFSPTLLRAGLVEWRKIEDLNLWSPCEALLVSNQLHSAALPIFLICCEGHTLPWLASGERI